MKYYIIAGEASGDLHGSNLIKELIRIDKHANIRFWGGDHMLKAGGILVRHYSDYAFMGFLDVILNINIVFDNLEFCKKDILEFNPDSIIFIDYPGFNMRIAKWAKMQNLKTHYYISPKIWAWKEKRIDGIKKYIDHMYTILPFEKKFYEKKHGFSVEYVGHPLIDAVKNFKFVDVERFKKENNLDRRPIIALLPGSRKQEITKVISRMLSVVDLFPDYQFVIAGAPSQYYNFYKKFLKDKTVVFIQDKTYELLSIANAAIVTSGTATLETAIFGVPQIVCYKTDWVTYQIARRIINLKYISLVNLIFDLEVVRELIQYNLNRKNIVFELNKILNPYHRSVQLKQYILLEEKLGGEGASEKTANFIFNNTNTANSD